MADQDARIRSTAEMREWLPFAGTTEEAVAVECAIAIGEERDALVATLRETYAFCAKHVRTLVEHVPFDALVELARAEADASAAKARDDDPARREAAERCHRALGRVSEVAGKHLEIAEAVRELRVLLGV